MTTTPLDAARLRGIFPFLPRGADAGRWQRWQNEIGMLLHDHAVNEARQAAGSAPVTGIWFSGGGRLAEANALPSAVVHAAPGRIGDVARGVAHRGGGVSHPLAPDATLAPTLAAVDPRASGASQPRVIVVDPVATDGGPSALHVRWLAPALELLRRKRLARLTLIADGRGAAVRWTATPPTLRQRVFARIAVKPFGVPVIPNS